MEFKVLVRNDKHADPINYGTLNYLASCGHVERQKKLKFYLDNYLGRKMNKYEETVMVNVNEMEGMLFDLHSRKGGGVMVEKGMILSLGVGTTEYKVLNIRFRKNIENRFVCVVAVMLLEKSLSDELSLMERLMDGKLEGMNH